MARWTLYVAIGLMFGTLLVGALSWVRADRYQAAERAYHERCDALMRAK